jgi:mycoredoxin
MATDKIKLYGTSWCGDSRRVREYFEINKIEFEWIDIDRDPSAAAIVEDITGGYRSVPTIVFPDGSALVEPSNYALKQKLSTL